MEIKISENESHKIVVPEKVSIKEFKRLMLKLKELEKFMGKFFEFNDIDNLPQNKIQAGGGYGGVVKIRRNKRNYPWYNSRDEAIRILKLHYFGSRKVKDEVCEKHGYESWNTISKGFHSMRRKFNITPKDVGISNFPRRCDGNRFDKLKIKDLVDENGKEKETKIEVN